MKHTLLILSRWHVTSLSAAAASTDPFDFDYEITGNMNERPALVFNDGSDPTCNRVQARPEGRWWPCRRSLYRRAWHSRSHQLLGRAVECNCPLDQGEQLHGGWGQRERGHADRVSPVSPTVLHSLAPVPVGEHSSNERNVAAVTACEGACSPGWTGSAQKDVDLTTAQSFATRDGENWMQSLDRLLGSVDLYADVDFNTRHVSLRRAAAKSTGVNYVASAAPTNASAAAPVAGAASMVPRRQVLRVRVFLLAILRLRRNSARSPFATATTRTSRSAFHEASKELNVFQDMDGHSLKPQWDDASNVVTLNRADRFVVSDGTDRWKWRVWPGSLRLRNEKQCCSEAVFDKDGSTYFKFADTVGHVTVSDVKHLGSGEQKGRYYKFNGTADQFIVNADGNVVNVTRKHDVQFFDRPKS